MIKPGVDISGLRPEMVLAYHITDVVMRKYAGHGARITSGLEGKHRRGSLHYVGQALDIGLPATNVETVTKVLVNDLGAQYDVVLEPDHLHIEFQPKKGPNL